MKTRKSIRLKSFDYKKAGSYFITTCVLNHHCYFGYIQDGKMILNRYGEIALEQFKWLSDNYPFVDVKIYTVMPNHVHAIIDIKPHKVDEIHLSLSQLVGAYKTRVSAAIHKLGLNEFTWQRSFYDHIIRNIHNYESIVNYIINNPLNWEKDRFYKQKSRA
jgi:putative transposase